MRQAETLPGRVSTCKTESKLSTDFNHIFFFHMNFISKTNKYFYKVIMG